MTKLPALRIKQGGIGDDAEHLTIYVTAMTLAQLRQHAQVDTWGPKNPHGYQRPLEPRRVKEVAKYVLEQQGILPTSVLLGTRPDDSPAIVEHGFESEGENVAIGELELPEGAVVWVVDGQTRYGGVDEAFEKTGDDRLADYLFPVTLMANVDRFAEMVHFNIVNTRQKKMQTDIVDRHLVEIQQKQGLRMLSQGSRGEKEYVRATATRLVDQLNEEAGPWYHQIAIPGVPGRDQGLVRQHAFVASLEPVLKDSWIKGRTDDDKVRVIANFWAGATDAWPEAFADPKEYRVQATVGLYALHMVLPVIIQRCLESRDLTRATIARILSGTGIGSTFWHKHDGDTLTLGTGMSSIRALAHYITESLPRTSDDAVLVQI